MQAGAFPELLSGQKRPCPGQAWREAGLSPPAGWRRLVDQLSPGHLGSLRSLERKGETVKGLLFYSISMYVICFILGQSTLKLGLRWICLSFHCAASGFLWSAASHTDW